MFAAIFTALLITCLLYTVLVYPIWVIVHAVQSKRSDMFKIFWVLAIIFGWAFTAFFYGFFVEKTGKFKTAFWLNLFSSITFTVLFISLVIFGLMALVRLNPPGVQRMIQKYESIEKSELTPQQRSDMRAALDGVDLTAKQSSMMKVNDAIGITDVLKISEELMKDGRFSAQDYSQFMAKVEAFKSGKLGIMALVEEERRKGQKGA